MNVSSVSLHNTDEIKVWLSVEMTAITALQRFGGMMLDAKE